jgi:lipoprotein-releasing system permease protein
MSLPWFIARRYLTARRRQAFISLISAVSVLGVGVGVMALVIASALMTGVQGELRDRIVGSTAHVFVNSVGAPFDNPAALGARLHGPDVVGVAPAIIGFGLLTAGGSQSFVTLKGIDPLLEPDVTDISRAMTDGSIVALVNRPPEAKDGVVLGADLARTLHVGVGDVVNVVTSELTPTLTGFVPHQRALQVVGTFRYGFYEFDSSYALVSLPTAEDLLNRGGPDSMQLRLANLNEAPAVRDRLRRELGQDYEVSDWTQLNAPLYSALWLEKVAISATIGLIVMVAALNIVASLVLLVMEKSRDIAILRTMGATSRTIRRIFVYQGLAIGLAGTLSGVILGVLVSIVADRYHLIQLPGDVYQITYLPFRVQPIDVTFIFVAAVAVCLLATLYPSRQAARLDPAEALRNQ